MKANRIVTNTCSKWTEADQGNTVQSAVWKEMWKLWTGI